MALWASRSDCHRFQQALLRSMEESYSTTFAAAAQFPHHHALRVDCPIAPQIACWMPEQLQVPTSKHYSMAEK
jgi:hypothetical protein